MNDLKAMFQQCFGTPLPPAMLSDEELFRLPIEGLLYGSRKALLKQYLLQSQVAEFIESAPDGYFLLGFYGHGINSYAFYYSRVDTWSKVLFRLPYGGAYMDNDTMQRAVREFLTRYFAFEPELRAKIENLVAIDSMWEGEYKITLRNGTLIEFSESLFHDPDFNGKLGELFRS